MPELPDVEVFKRYLDATSLHKSVRHVEVRDPRVLGSVSIGAFRRELAGRKFVSTRRHGKYLFAKLDGASWLTLHFGMTGSLRYFKDLQSATPYDRIILGFANGYHLAYVSLRVLGEVGLASDVEGFVRARGLGPDALGLTLQDFREALKGRRGALKSTLMDQKLVAGIGNVYSDEILLQAGLGPKTRADRLDDKELQELFRKMRRVLRTAIERGADARRFPRTFLAPERRRGGRCPRCKSPLERAKVAGRSAYCCPKCQRMKE